MTGPVNEHSTEKCKNGVLNPAFETIPGSKNGAVITMPNNQMCLVNKKNEKNEKNEKEDPFAVCLDEPSDLEGAASNPFVNLIKIICVFGLLYLFICSLDFMATGFRMISGKATGQVFRNNYIKNPIVGLMIGILVTVLVQSSSTSTSIIVSMVNSQILYVREAIPMIMGSNIGTSVTNTIVSLTQIGDRGQFRRAFAGATVHDMFNWLTVITLISVEIPFHMLEKLSGTIVDNAFQYESKQTGTEIKILKHITEPFTKLIVKVDNKVITGWSQNDTSYDNMTLNPCVNAKLFNPNDTAAIVKQCDYLFAYIELDDSKSGVLLLIMSLFLLCFALVMIVKILKSMLKGTIATMVKRVINADIPYIPWITGYLALLIGALMTVIVQSSSIFTSTLTPLIGLGLISVERSYPLTLGSNIGTTTTSLLASIAGEGDGLKRSVQIALVHLFFNVIGILIFYPIPFMRWPIPMAKALGNVTADYRWFAILYLVMVFFVLPAFVFALSFGGIIALEIVGIPLLVLLAIIVIVNLMQRRLPNCLPGFLRTWDFLPLPLHSLEPYDRLFLSAPCCKRFRLQEEKNLDVAVVVSTKNNGLDNPMFDSETYRSRL